MLEEEQRAHLFYPSHFHPSLFPSAFSCFSKEKEEEEVPYLFEFGVLSALDASLIPILSHVIYVEVVNFVCEMVSYFSL